MEVTFINPGAEEMIRQILEFQTPETPAWWLAPLYHFYPQLDLTNQFQDLRCFVSLNPIEPRFLQERSFSVFYLNSGKGAVFIPGFLI